MANGCLMRGNCSICYSYKKKITQKAIIAKLHRAFATGQELCWASYLLSFPDLLRLSFSFSSPLKNKNSTHNWKAQDCQSQDLNIALLSPIHPLNLLPGFIVFSLGNINDKE